MRLGGSLDAKPDWKSGWVGVSLVLREETAKHLCNEANGQDARSTVKANEGINSVTQKRCYNRRRFKERSLKKRYCWAQPA